MDIDRAQKIAYLQRVQEFIDRLNRLTQELKESNNWDPSARGNGIDEGKQEAGEELENLLKEFGAHQEPLTKRQQYDQGNDNG